MNKYLLVSNDIENLDKDYLKDLVERLEAKIVYDNDWAIVIETIKEVESYPEFVNQKLPWLIQYYIECQI